MQDGFLDVKNNTNILYLTFCDQFLINLTSIFHALKIFIVLNRNLLLTYIDKTRSSPTSSPY